MSWTVVGYWLLDRFWPTLEIPTSSPVARAPKWIGIGLNSIDVIESAYQLLKDEAKALDDDLRIVESKLQSISSVATIATTILVAIVAFLTSGRFKEFTEPSVLAVLVFACYIEIQFLRAFLAAVQGLSRKQFSAFELTDIPPSRYQSKSRFLLKVCEKLASIISDNRIVVNAKVEQMALGHEALKNAVAGLFLMVASVLAISILETRYYATGVLLLVLFFGVLLTVLAVNLRSKSIR